MTHTRKKLHPKWYAFLILAAIGLILLFFFSGYRFSGLFIVSASMLIPIWHVTCLISDINLKKGMLMLESFFCILLLIAMAITGAYIIRSAHGTKNPDAKYLVVLGAGVNGDVPSLSLQDRIDQAIVYLNEHPDAVAIVSGGQGEGENITEAQCMYQVMVASGIDPERVWMEPNATNTLENIRYSMDVIEEHQGTRPEKIAIVSSEYHLHRAAMFARQLDLDAELVPAATSILPLRWNYYLREIFAVWYYAILGG